MNSQKLSPGQKLVSVISYLHLHLGTGHADEILYDSTIEFSDSEDEREYSIQPEFFRDREKMEQECRENNVQMVYYSGEYDSNVTKFERLSNERKIGVVCDPGDEITGLLGLALLRPLIDVPSFSTKTNPVEFFVSLIRLDDEIIEEDDFDPRVAARVNRVLDWILSDDVMIPMSSPNLPKMDTKTLNLLGLQILKREHAYWNFNPKTKKRIQYWTIDEITDAYLRF